MLTICTAPGDGGVKRKLPTLKKRVLMLSLERTRPLLLTCDSDLFGKFAPLGVDLSLEDRRWDNAIMFLALSIQPIIVGS